MITIRNTQRSIDIDKKKIKTSVQKILNFLGYTDYDIGIWITTNRTIQRYNKQYRGKNKPTDILSFAYHTHLKPGQHIKIQSPDDANLGDLIISAYYVNQVAEQLHIPFDQHLIAIIVHGICHLLGYDHAKESDYQKMVALEATLTTLVQ